MEKKVLKFTTVKRLAGVNVCSGSRVIEYELPKTKRTKFIVDDSCFSPVSEAVKSLERYGAPSAEEIKSYYDFADGKDTGISVPIVRNPRNSSDLAEVSTSIVTKIEDLNNAVAEINDNAKRKAKLRSRINSLYSPPANNPGNSSDGK